MGLSNVPALPPANRSPTGWRPESLVTTSDPESPPALKSPSVSSTRI
jgi:hypothetical protein